MLMFARYFFQATGTQLTWARALIARTITRGDPGVAADLMRISTPLKFLHFAIGGCPGSTRHRARRRAQAAVSNAVWAFDERSYVTERCDERSYVTYARASEIE